MYSVFANGGFDVYTNIVYNGQKYDTILSHQMELIKFCTELYFLKTRYKLLTCTSSIQMPSVKIMNEKGVEKEVGLQVYNNIDVLSGPNQDIETGQDWNITWDSDQGLKQQMTFHRIHKSLRTLPHQAAIAALNAREQADNKGLKNDVAKAQALAAYDAVLMIEAGQAAVDYVKNNEDYIKLRNDAGDGDVSAGGGNKRRKSTKGKKIKGKKTKKQTSK